MPLIEMKVIEGTTSGQEKQELIEYFTELTRDEPAVISPLGQPFPGSAAHSRQGQGQLSYVIHVH